MHAANFLRSWRDGRFPQITPPLLTDDDAGELTKRIVRAYEAAYSIGADGLDVSDVLKAWKANPGRNPRRLIRSIIDALDARRSLTAASAARAI